MAGKSVISEMIFLPRNTGDSKKTSHYNHAIYLALLMYNNCALTDYDCRPVRLPPTDDSPARQSKIPLSRINLPGQYTNEAA